MAAEAGPLAGIRVVEYGGLVAAAYAAKLMADLGADVIKVEPPEGDLARRRGPFPPGQEADPNASGLFIALNTNKRGVVLDLLDRGDRSWLIELLAGADVFVHNCAPREARRLGLDDEEIRARCPRLVHTWITPFGLTGPHAEYEADELNVVAAGGWLSLSPGNAPSFDYPPLKAFGRQADYQAGATAALATMGALFARSATGTGQLVDVSAQEVIGTELEVAFAHWTYAGSMSTHVRRGSTAGGPLRCKDGYVFVAITPPQRWSALVEILGNPEWARDPHLAEPGAIGERWEELLKLIEVWTSERTVEVVVEIGTAARLPLAPISTIASLVESPHLRARGFFRTFVQPGAGEVTIPGPPYVLERTPWQLRRPAPRMGEHTVELRAASHRRCQTNAYVAPLHGIRVVDFTWMWAGPHCTEQLAHLGAEVIRIETPDHPCLNRILPPFADGIVGPNRAGGFNQFNQGKRSLALDLKHPDGQRVAHELVKISDVVVENFAVGVADRLGLGWEQLSRINPRLVMASISGYGQTGPYRNHPAFGQPILMFSGLARLTGYCEGDWRGVGTSYPDPTAALHAAFAVLAALWERERNGRGQRIDVSLTESFLQLVAEGILPYTMRGEQPAPRGNRDPFMAPHGVYPCAGENRWLTIVVRDEEEWQAFTTVVGESLATDERFRTLTARKQNEDALDEIVRAWTGQRDAWEATFALQAVGVPAFPVQDMRDLAKDAHLRQRSYFTELEHPEAGRQLHTGIPWKFSGTPLTVDSPAPCLGEANEYVVRELLKRSAEEYQRLVAANVLR